ncbi:MD-2-related lipid-recognition protein [Osmia lignaria lignaria]|uniref:MD-2-related lipid-recognition protein-like n=1 Tax=Osmia bicornis bicornis TaxID=1437191 RepID=UPI0010F78BB2|nr:MD-2-related lipid-recognition protein-like [Osmia bicornis bicornis]
MNRHSEFIFVFLLLALSMVYAELIPWRPCPYPDSNTPSNCTIHEVYLDPCKEAAEEKPCKVKRGITSNMTFHYTPDFSSDKMNVRIFWASQVMDIPFLGMDPDACLSTTCPVEAGQRYVYHAEIPILKKYPVRTYDVKWKIWGEQEQECCFMFQFKIVK